jgi:hypothetical protein
MRRFLVTLLLLAALPAAAKEPPPLDPAGDPGQQAATVNLITSMLAGGGRSSSKYDAIADPDAYQAALTQYGIALESALIALVRPALTGAASNSDGAPRNRRNFDARTDQGAERG